MNTELVPIREWLEQFVAAVQQEFTRRVVFMGIQGSYGRNEATPASDLDVVVILDKLEFDDLTRYKALLAPLPFREKICGFISGQMEIRHWERSDLFQFCHDTTPLFGTLDFVLDLIEKSDVQRAVRIGACNIYHACCHNFLHETNLDILGSLYKTVFFVLQAKYYYNTNTYYRNKSELKPHLDPEDLDIMESGERLQQLRKEPEETVQGNILDEYSQKILNWSSRQIDGEKSGPMDKIFPK